MFLLLPLVLALVGYAIYRMAHHRSLVTTGGTVAIAASEHRPFWPSTLVGRLGVGALGLWLLSNVLINVVLVPFLSLAFVVAALVLTAVARFGLHDRSTSVLVAFVLTAAMVAFAVLFLLGEVFVGHD